MSTTGCLMTSTPQFTPPQHTAPFLVEATASPDTRAVVVIDSASSQGANPMLTFSANVISQDDPTGTFSQVESELLLDCGISRFMGQAPFFGTPLGGSNLNPGTIDQTTDRRVSANWFVGDPDVAPGCHTVTLVASHQFPRPWQCPCPGDYSMITWQVLRCDSSAGTCTSLPLGACPVEPDQLTATTCDKFLATVGSSSCSAADGGAP
jgi:hypothetical protein